MRKGLIMAGFVLAALAANDVAAQQRGKAEGEVRKVDVDAGKVTVRHGPVPELDMQGMTMVFRVRDPAVLQTLRAGERIGFTVNKDAGTYYLEDPVAK